MRIFSFSLETVAASTVTALDALKKKSSIQAIWSGRPQVQDLKSLTEKKIVPASQNDSAKSVSPESLAGNTSAPTKLERLIKTLKKVIDFISKFSLQLAFATGMTLFGVAAVASGNFLNGFLALSSGASAFYAIYLQSRASSSSVEQALQKTEGNIDAINKANTDNQVLIENVGEELTEANSNVAEIESSNKIILSLARKNAAIPRIVQDEAEKQGVAIVKLKENLEDIGKLTKEVEKGQAAIKDQAEEAAKNINEVREAAAHEIRMTAAFSTVGAVAGYKLGNHPVAGVAGGLLAPMIYKALFNNAGSPAVDKENPNTLTKKQLEVLGKFHTKLTEKGLETNLKSMLILSLTKKLIDLNNKEATCKIENDALESQACGPNFM